MLQIFTPASELPFAGHPLVGTSWLLHEHGHGTDRQRATAGDVDALAGPPDDLGFVDAWAWLDQAAGLVRCRVFASEYGIAEDEAIGAAAVRGVTQLGRPVEIRQGRGSVILAIPGPAGTAEVGGVCVLDDVRSFEVPS